MHQPQPRTQLPIGVGRKLSGQRIVDSRAPVDDLADALAGPAPGSHRAFATAMPQDIRGSLIRCPLQLRRLLASHACPACLSGDKPPQLGEVAMEGELSRGSLRLPELLALVELTDECSWIHEFWVGFALRAVDQLRMRSMCIPQDRGRQGLGIIGTERQDGERSTCHVDQGLETLPLIDLRT